MALFLHGNQKKAAEINTLFLILSLPIREDREARFLASKMGIIATFRSWAGRFIDVAL